MTRRKFCYHPQGHSHASIEDLMLDFMSSEATGLPAVSPANT